LGVFASRFRQLRNGSAGRDQRALPGGLRPEQCFVRAAVERRGILVVPQLRGTGRNDRVSAGPTGAAAASRSRSYTAGTSWSDDLDEDDSERFAADPREEVRLAQHGGHALGERDEGGVAR
jgi:hypothetical protein